MVLTLNYHVDWFGGFQCNFINRIMYKNYILILFVLSKNILYCIVV